MKNIGIKFAGVALVLCAAMPAYAGKGGSAAKIKAAIDSTSVDAIIAEVERTEALACSDCVDLVMRLTEDARYDVRAVAAWWFAKRPALRKALAEQFEPELLTGGTIKVRNAADFLGRTMTYTALPSLRAAIKRDVGSEAKLAIVRAVEYMGHKGGNEALSVAMADRDPVVRAAAARAWRDIYDQVDAAPVLALLGDADATVRSDAATTVGGMKMLAGREKLEALVVSDASPIVRRNAAWALGKLGQAASASALSKAAADESGLVRMTAKTSLGQLR
jgi:hypothetical protein